DLGAEREAAEPAVEVRDQAHTAIHRRRRPARTASEVTRSTRLIAIPASGRDSSARYTASGSVCVRPGKLPAKVIVAPNSPSARAQASTVPATSDGATSGSVTRRKTVQGDA